MYSAIFAAAALINGFVHGLPHPQEAALASNGSFPLLSETPAASTNGSSTPIPTGPPYDPNAAVGDGSRYPLFSNGGYTGSYQSDWYCYVNDANHAFVANLAITSGHTPADAINACAQQFDACKAATGCVVMNNNGPALAFSNAMANIGGPTGQVCPFGNCF
jgi:hypothetical protein